MAIGNTYVLSVFETMSPFDHNEILFFQNRATWTAPSLAWAKSSRVHACSTLSQMRRSVYFHRREFVPTLILNPSTTETPTPQIHNGNDNIEQTMETGNR